MADLKAIFNLDKHKQVAIAVFYYYFLGLFPFTRLMLKSLQNLFPEHDFISST